jgi:hypothetical protein
MICIRTQANRTQHTIRSLSLYVQIDSIKKYFVHQKCYKNTDINFWRTQWAVVSLSAFCICKTKKIKKKKTESQFVYRFSLQRVFREQA